MEKRFIYRPQMKASDIDMLNHVNNEVYLLWLIEAAIAHSTHLGFTMQKYLELGMAFVVRKHELEYLLPVFKEDEVRVETWIVPFEGSRARRHYEIINNKTNKVVLSGNTLWVFIDMKTGRPMKIPDFIHAAFEKFNAPEN